MVWGFVVHVWAGYNVVHLFLVLSELLNSCVLLLRAAVNPQLFPPKILFAFLQSNSQNLLTSHQFIFTIIISSHIYLQSSLPTLFWSQLVDFVPYLFSQSLFLSTFTRKTSQCPTNLFSQSTFHPIFILSRLCLLHFDQNWWTLSHIYFHNHYFCPHSLTKPPNVPPIYFHNLYFIPYLSSVVFASFILITIGGLCPIFIFTIII